MALPPEAGDLITRIGRTWDAYEHLSLRVVGVEVSPEAEAELKRLYRLSSDVSVTTYFKDGHEVPLTVNKHSIGTYAYKLQTQLVGVSPEMAKALYGANRSRLADH